MRPGITSIEECANIMKKILSNTEPRNFSWLKVNEIAGCAAPRDLYELQWLKNQGIQHILCLSRVSPIRLRTNPLFVYQISIIA